MRNFPSVNTASGEAAIRLRFIVTLDFLLGSIKSN
jgi:hypothetical protein